MHGQNSPLNAANTLNPNAFSPINRGYTFNWPIETLKVPEISQNHSLIKDSFDHRVQ